MKGDKLYSAKCSQIGMDCEFIAQGRTIDEVEMIMMRHVAHEHAEVVRFMQKEDLMGMEHRIKEIIA